MDEIELRVRLLHLPGFGAARLHRLLACFGGSALQLWRQPWKVLTSHCQLPMTLEQCWQCRESFTSWRDDLALAERQAVCLLSSSSEQYPKGLLDLHDPPPLLYVLGKLTPQDRHAVGFVGSRNATPYGRAMASAFAKECASAGLTVVSGLARGIDTEAHKGALAGGRTIAVIGSGLSKLYPPENKQLACAIARQGALISELPMATPPDRQTFPQRNRIIAALSKAMLLLEAPQKSGALISLACAEKLGRSCFALPGRVDYPTFEGNHQLIARGQAKLIDKPEQLFHVFEEMNFSQTVRLAPSDALSRPEEAASQLSAEEAKLLHKLPADELTLEEIALLCSLGASKAAVVVMGLVLKKKLQECPGQRYKKR